MSSGLLLKASLELSSYPYPYFSKWCFELKGRTEVAQILVDHHPMCILDKVTNKLIGR